MHEYDLIAEWYAKERRGPGGVPELESLIGSLPQGASVFDVGCGNGVPLTRKLLDAGFSVLAIDSSSRMLEYFQANCPVTPFICDPVQSADLNEQLFDAAVAWGEQCHLR